MKKIRIIAFLIAAMLLLTSCLETAKDPVPSASSPTESGDREPSDDEISDNENGSDIGEDERPVRPNKPSGGNTSGGNGTATDDETPTTANPDISEPPEVDNDGTTTEKPVDPDIDADGDGRPDGDIDDDGRPGNDHEDDTDNDGRPGNNNGGTVVDPDDFEKPDDGKNDSETEIPGVTPPNVGIPDDTIIGGGGGYGDTIGGGTGGLGGNGGGSDNTGGSVGGGTDDPGDTDDPTPDPDPSGCTNHTYGGWNDVVAATCTEGGVQQRTCSKCGAAETRNVSPHGHMLVTLPAVAPTCTQTGLTAGEQCGYCKTVITEQRVEDALGHDYKNGTCTRCGQGKASVGLEYNTLYDGNCEVVGIGTCTDVDIIIPQTSPDGLKVTEIGMGAFRDNTSIKSVTMGANILVIGDSAFSGCTALSTVNFGESVNYIGRSAFYNCSSLTEIRIPDYVTRIEYQTFAHCPAVKTVYVGKSLTRLDSYAFMYTTNFETLTCSEENDTFHSAGNCLIKTADKSLVLGSHKSVIPTDGSVTTIASCAFYGSTALTSVNIGAPIVKVEAEAFIDCVNIKDVTVGANVEYIGRGAFLGCTSIENMTLPYIGSDILGTSDGYSYSQKLNYLFSGTNESVPATLKTIIITHATMIGYDALAGAVNVTTLVLPDTLKTINGGAFADLVNLKTLVIPSSVEDMGSGILSSGALEELTVPFVGNTRDGDKTLYYLFSDVDTYMVNTTLKKVTVTDARVIGKNAFVAFRGVEQINILGTDVKSIEDGAFRFATALVLVELPAGIEYIAQNAFINCTSLKSIVIPEGVTYIGEYAFMDCTSLESAVLPTTLRTIEYAAFSGCTSLKTIEIPEGLTTIKGSAFSATGLEELTLPSTVSEIGENAFYNNQKLKKLTLTNGIKTIGEDAFGKTLPETLIFKGTEAEWDALMSSYEDETNKYKFKNLPVVFE